MASKAAKEARERNWRIHQLKMIKTIAPGYMTPRHATAVIQMVNEELAELGVRRDRL